jgi:hypothetical protein
MGNQRVLNFRDKFMNWLKFRGKSKKIIIELKVNPRSTLPDWEKIVDAFVSKISKAKITFRLDKRFKPISAPKRPRAPKRIIFRGTVDKDKFQELKSLGAHAVWKDAVLIPHTNPCQQITGYCGSNACFNERNAVGTIDMAAEQIGAKQLWQKGVTGAGVLIGVIDSGVKLCRIGDRMKRKSGVPPHNHDDLEDYLNVDGWPTDPENYPGFQHPGSPYFSINHGTKTAFNILKICPDAQILDIATAQGELTESQLIDVFQWIRSRPSGERPHVIVVCSGLAHYCLDESYAVRPNHPLTEAVLEVIDDGILVCYSAGNCGELGNQGSCKDSQCDVCDEPNLPRRDGCIGRGKSIWGANAHPDVISVGAATLDDGTTSSKWIGLSSQGPTKYQKLDGDLETDSRREKPDLCAPSHFFGEGTLRSDEGTSTAGAVMGGVLGLLKSAALNHEFDLDQNRARQILRDTATPLCEQIPQHQQYGRHDWINEVGKGMVNVWNAADQLMREEQKSWPVDDTGHSGWNPPEKNCPWRIPPQAWWCCGVIIMIIILIIVAILSW